MRFPRRACKPCKHEALAKRTQEKTSATTQTAVPAHRHAENNQGQQKHKRATDMTYKYIKAHATHTQVQQSITKMHEGLNRQPE